MRKTLPTFVLIGVAVLASGACSDSESTPQPPPVAPAHTVTTSVLVSATAGGRIDLPDGATLEIPAGALPADTTIVVTQPVNQTDESGFLHYQFAPSGLQFNLPVVFTAPYTDRPEGDPLISAWQYSIVNPQEDVGGELTRWQGLDATARDMDANRVTYELEHFSFLYLAVAVPQYAFLVKDIPPEYLLPGDILFSLTRLSGKWGPDFNPGHVGMFAGGRQACTKVVSDRVIEATPPKVISTTLATYKASNTYLGAYRPADGPLTPAEQQGVLSYLVKHIGDDYGIAVPGTDFAIPVGEGNLTEGSFSCVGLAEAALDSVDRGVIRWDLEHFVSVPFELYQGATQVRHIVAEVGDQIDIPVYGIVVHPASPWFATTIRGFYCTKGSTCCHRGVCNPHTITAAIPPGAGTFTREESGIYHYRWSPTEEDAGRIHFITFDLSTNPYVTPYTGAPTQQGTYTRNEILRVEVRPCPGDSPDSGVSLDDGGDSSTDADNSDGSGHDASDEVGSDSSPDTGDSDGSTPDAGSDVAVDSAADAESDGPAPDASVDSGGDASDAAISPITMESCSQLPGDFYHSHPWTPGPGETVAVVCIEPGDLCRVSNDTYEDQPLAPTQCSSPAGHRALNLGIGTTAPFAQPGAGWQLRWASYGEVGVASARPRFDVDESVIVERQSDQARFRLAFRPQATSFRIDSVQPYTGALPPYGQSFDCAAAPISFADPYVEAPAQFFARICLNPSTGDCRIHGNVESTAEQETCAQGPYAISLGYSDALPGTFAGGGWTIVSSTHGTVEADYVANFPPGVEVTVVMQQVASYAVRFVWTGTSIDIVSIEKL